MGKNDVTCFLCHNSYNIFPFSSRLDITNHQKKNREGTGIMLSMLMWVGIQNMNHCIDWHDLEFLALTRFSRVTAA